MSPYSAQKSFHHGPARSQQRGRTSRQSAGLSAYRWWYTARGYQRCVQVRVRSPGARWRLAWKGEVREGAGREGLAGDARHLHGHPSGDALLRRPGAGVELPREPSSHHAGQGGRVGVIGSAAGRRHGFVASHPAGDRVRRRHGVPGKRSPGCGDGGAGHLQEGQPYRFGVLRHEDVHPRRARRTGSRGRRRAAGSEAVSGDDGSADGGGSADAGEGEVVG